MASNLKIHSVRLYKGDLEALGELYPQSGANRALREIVRRHIREAQNVLGNEAEPSELPEIDLEEHQ